MREYKYFVKKKNSKIQKFSKNKISLSVIRFNGPTESFNILDFKKSTKKTGKEEKNIYIQTHLPLFLTRKLKNQQIAWKFRLIGEILTETDQEKTKKTQKIKLREDLQNQ